MIKKTGGNWNPEERQCYFLASNPGTLFSARNHSDHFLIAVNELGSDASMEIVHKLIGQGSKVFIDSGIFNLTNNHMRAHGITMDKALALPPDKIDGFDALFERYCRVIDAVKDTCWGYIEMDQGGRENKIKTRERLESMGYNPIPVYHPLNDGWEYFDELAEQYDRICFGNVVQASAPVRKRLLATAWERRKKYPHLWIHLLGMTPNQHLNAYPVDSLDSSTWLAAVRWPQAFGMKSALKTVSRAGLRFAYKREGDPDDTEMGDWDKGIALGASDAYFNGKCWHRLRDDYKDVLHADEREMT